MARYVKKLTRVGSIGPSEERGFGLWVGYDIDGVDGDLSAHGLIRVDDGTDTRGVDTFHTVTLAQLGIRGDDGASEG